MFKGKAIYNPSGKAGEYSYWACNFYVGCSNGCEYCYCKKGILAGVMGQDNPQLKKCFRNDADAIDCFESEAEKNLQALIKHGLFFSFTTDPMLRRTIGLTSFAVKHCISLGIPVKILTKNTWWTDYFHMYFGNPSNNLKRKIAFGFTLTGHDELEPGANTNAERIEAMKKLHDAGFKTFASIEPVINFKDSLEMINKACFYCDLFKIGLESGKRYSMQTVRDFVFDIIEWVDYPAKIYFKDSLLKTARIERSELPASCVTRDFNIFNYEF